MALDESLISDPRKQKWVDEISNILNHQLLLPFEYTPTPSIFQVPEFITKEKPEAYEPQHIGLGPNHHFRPQPYKIMEQKKLTVVQKVVQNSHINDFNVVIDKVREVLPLVRACYDMFLQDDDDTLAWIFAIDGVFVLEAIYNNNNDTIQDILMMENQIPFMVLKGINDALMKPDSGTSFDWHNMFTPSTFHRFSLTLSPLDLCEISAAPKNPKHLLDYMYQSIIRKGSISGGMDRMQLDTALEFVNQLPKDEIVQIYKRTITALETFSQSKAPIPSASEYHQRAGIRFCNLFVDQGIGDICIDGEKFSLPFLRLSKDSEIVLRNLVAYEMLLTTESDEFPLTEYMSLMCGLIKNTKDVELLRKEYIIQGDLGVEEVVKLFTGMRSSTLSMEKKKKEKSKLTCMLEEANKVYENRPSMKMKTDFVLKKLANWLLVILKAIGGFVESSWKIVAFMISIGTVILLTSQAYCDMYGCEKTKVTLLSCVSR